MEFLQLKYFYESAKDESFVKTAKRHRVPSSSVSASIKRLEQELGCKLFDRYRNAIKLNERGKRFFASVGYVFDELETATAELVNIEQKEVKMLVKSLRRQILDAIIKYKKLHSDIEFKVYFDNKDLHDGEFDIIIGSEDNRYAEYQKRELFKTPICLRTCTNSHLVGKKLRLKDLCHEPFVTMGKTTYMHNLLIDACKRVGFSPKIVVEVNDMACYNKCIKEGLGIGVSRLNPRITEKFNGSAMLDVIDFNIMQNFYIYYKRSGIRPSVLNFVEYIKNNI